MTVRVVKLKGILREVSYMSEVTSKVSPVPHEWPGPFGLFKYSKEAVGFNVWTIIAILALSIAVSWLIGVIFGYDTQTNALSIGGQIVSLLVAPFFTICLVTALFAGIKRQKADFGDVLKAVELKLWLNVLIQTIVISVILTVSVLLLVVPFFFVFPRLILAPFILVDTKGSPIDAIKQSWELTKGNVGKVYGIVGAEIVFALIMITIIGIPIAIYLLVAYMAAAPLLYRFLSAKQ